jgi:hypothetical protein
MIDGLVTSYTKSPELTHPPVRGAFFLGTSAGNVFFIDLDAFPNDMTSVPPIAGFKTNPVSQALYLSRRLEEGDILLVGGEMSDTMIYYVPPHGTPQTDQGSA